MANSSVIKTEAMLKREVIKSQLLRARAEKLKIKNSVRTNSNFSFFSKQTTATQNCTPNDSIMMMDQSLKRCNKCLIFLTISLLIKASKVPNNSINTITTTEIMPFYTKTRELVCSPRKTLKTRMQQQTTSKKILKCERDHTPLGTTT